MINFLVQEVDAWSTPVSTQGMADAGESFDVDFVEELEEVKVWCCWISSGPIEQRREKGGLLSSSNDP